MREGHLSAELPEPGDGVIVLDIPAGVWDGMTQAMPPVFHNDISAAMRLGVTRQCDEILWWQYMPATQRALELCRAPVRHEKLQNPRGVGISQNNTSGEV